MLMDHSQLVTQTSEQILETATTKDKDFTAMGISYAVTDDMSISYNTSEIEYEDSHY